MNLAHYYYYWANAIPPRICDMIIQYGKSIKKESHKYVKKYHLKVL